MSEPIGKGDWERDGSSVALTHARDARSNGQGSCIHCTAAALEIQELRAALGLSGRLTEQRAIERRFGLTRQQARLAQALYDAGGRVVPRSTLDSFVLSQDAAAEGSDALKCVVCTTRAKLGRDVIDTAEGGYAMTAAGRALIYTAIKLTDQEAA